MPVEVEVINVTKCFGDVVAVDDVSFEVMKNEFFSLLGPSGCGKTTTLRIIAGLEELDEGTVKLGGEVVNNVPSHKRHIGMVFQGLALFPHMSVFDNIAFGLKMYKFPSEKNEKTRAFISHRITYN
jgi:multiple sugar transport system ATP-binding protein